MTDRERLHQLYKEQFFDRYDLHEVCDKARAENGVLWPDFIDTAENDWHMGLFVGWMNGYQAAKADQSAEVQGLIDAASELIEMHFLPAHIDFVSGSDVGTRLEKALDALARSASDEQ